MKDGVGLCRFFKVRDRPAMSSQDFSFPPPPPPPPRQQQPPQQNHGTYPPPYGQSYYGQRGGRGGGGRGRGRGSGNRGRGRGGQYPASSSSYSNNAAPPSVGYPPMNYAGLATQPLTTTPTPGLTAPQYAATSPPASTAFPSQTFSPPTAAQMSPYQQATSYNAVYNQSTAQATPVYPSAMPPYQHTSPSPSMMGPPIHWGFEKTAPTGGFPGGQHNGWGPRPFNNNTYNNHMSPGGKSKHLNKRDHASAFGKPQSTVPRTPAPPPVPSFGNPLPSKPPPPSDSMRHPKKKKRTHNQLGLTPKTEEHESSEEEDDVDEESKLASGGGTVNAPLRFTYKGRTATLQSPEEIAAWIEERKKRFPTQVRVEEKKKVMEEAKKAREETQKQKRDSRKQNPKQAQKEPRGQKQANGSGDPIDAVAKAKQKADKLRQKLLREQRRVAKAEADAERARIKVEALQRVPTGFNLEGTETVSGDASVEQQAVTRALTEDQMDAAEISSFPDTSDDSDWTSSSGSDVSESEESDDNDGDDSAPEEMTSRRGGPEQVPPPPRENIKKRVCRHFARNGRCLRGDKCNFLHETPERKVKAKPTPQKGRKGLLQMLLDRQEEDDNYRVMEAIMSLGEQGLLNGPAAPKGHHPPSAQVNGEATTVSGYHTAAGTDSGGQSEGKTPAPIPTVNSSPAMAAATSATS